MVGRSLSRPDACLYQCGVDAACAPRAASGVRDEFYRLDAWSLIGGAVDALRMTLEAGYRNVILSNHPPELPALVERLGLSALVEGTITSATVGVEKPNPEIFAYALRYVGVSSGEGVWMVGDNPIADVEGIHDAVRRPAAGGLCVGEAIDRSGDWRCPEYHFQFHFR